VRRDTRRDKYLLRGFFATTLGLMWLAAAKQLVEFRPGPYIAVFCMAFGAEMVAIGLIRERARRSLP